VWLGDQCKIDRAARLLQRHDGGVGSAAFRGGRPTPIESANRSRYSPSRRGSATTLKIERSGACSNAASVAVAISATWDQRDKVLPRSGDDARAAAQIGQRIFLKRPRPYKTAAAQYAPMKSIGCQRAHKVFHRDHRGADHPASRRSVKRHLFCDPLVAAIGIGHDDALLQVLLRARLQRGLKQNSYAIGAETRIGVPGMWRTHVARESPCNMDDCLTAFQKCGELLLDV